MKRYGNLFNDITATPNLIEAHRNARKGKSHYKEVQWVNNNQPKAIFDIQQSLLHKTFTTSKYVHMTKIDKGKKRIISKLPYYPDRIIHHALLQIIGSILIKSLIRDTFQSIPNRGTHDCRKRIESFLQNQHDKENLFFTKLDIKQYYPNVDNEILKNIIRQKIKCKDTLWLIDNIIDSKNGLTIGSYTSQIFGNIYLNSLDWFIKQSLQIKGYFRYCDDLLLIHKNEETLLYALQHIIKYIKSLKLSLRHTPQIHSFNQRQGFEFIGYRYTPKGTFLKSKIFTNSINAIHKLNDLSLPSYWGWNKPLNYKGAFNL